MYMDLANVVLKMMGAESGGFSAVARNGNGQTKSWIRDIKHWNITNAQSADAYFIMAYIENPLYTQSTLQNKTKQKKTGTRL